MVSTVERTLLRADIQIHFIVALQPIFCKILILLFIQFLPVKINGLLFSTF